MNEEQFLIIESYLEGFRTELNSVNFKNLASDVDKIWDKLDEQNKLLEKILASLNER